MPPAEARRSSSNTSSGSTGNPFSQPSRAASAFSTARSLRQPGGGSAAWRRSRTRPSRLVRVPVSSAHCVTGSTTSASRADSESTTSQTTRKSSARMRSSTCAARGADTTGLDAISSSARTPSGVSRPSASSSSYALRPGPGSTSGSTPHTRATCSLAAASARSRYPGNWSAFCPCSRPPCPLPCPVRQP